jgi:solute:Na+ symporter, SSS family
MQNVSIIDLAIILGYLLVMLGVGLWFQRKAKNLTDYALAGKSLGYVVMIGTLVGACIGAASTMGKAGKSYESGIIFLIAGAGYVTGLILFGFFSKRLREIGIWTVPDALRKRYGPGMDLATGAAMFLTVIAIFGGQIIGIGLIFTAVGKSFGLTYTTAILLSGVILIFYTMVGGLFAVVYSDLIQSAIMLLSIGLILPIVVLTRSSELGQTWTLLQPHAGNLLGGMSPFYLVSILIIDATFCMIDPGLWQRANAAKSTSVIRTSMFVTAGVYVYWSVVCVLLGVLGSGLIPNIVAKYGSTDAIIPVLVVSYLPPVIKGLCLTGLMAVMMSTASVCLLISGTTVANDLVKPFRPEMKDKGLLLTAKLTILIVGALGIVFALFMKSLFDILLLAFAVYVSAVFVPIMAALFWDKATRQGAIVSSIVSTVICVGLYAVKMFMKVSWLEPIMVSLVASLFIMVGVSLATYKPESATPRLFPKRGEQQ